MRIYDGNSFDRTNRRINRFLEVNSCGFQKQDMGYTVIRKIGRMDYHLVLVTKGELKVIYKEKTYILHAGGVFLYEPNISQYYEAVKPTATFWLHFTGTAAKEILKNADIIPGVFPLDFAPSLNDCFLKLVQNFSRPGAKNYVPGALLNLLACLSDAIHRKLTPYNSQIMSDILTYINQNYDKELTIDMLSNLCGYSKSRFTHLFTEFCGTSPKQYIISVRLQNACNLLSVSTYPIKAVAENCGFSDALYFCRLFKKHYGVSPKLYRSEKQ